MEVSLQELKGLMVDRTEAAPSFVPGEKVFIRTVTYHLPVAPAGKGGDHAKRR